MSIQVDQILAGFADGDAISQEALHIRAILRSEGINSEIYSDLRHTSSSMMAECRDVKDYHSGDALIHHYSIGSPVLDLFVAAPARKVLIYHNITPDHYFKAFDENIAAQLKSARQLLPAIANQMNAIWADSEFNALELKNIGISNVQVFPLLYNLSYLDLPDDPVVSARMSGPLKTFLSVGRIVPNKRIEIAIKAFYYFARKIDPFSRLVIIGSGRSCPRYYDLLQMLVNDLDLPNVCFEGFVSPQSLPTYYRKADVFVSTSDHEGYCLPLVEAMFHETLVLAHQVGGIPEALGGAGVMYKDLEPEGIAVLMDMMTSRDRLKQDILSSQKRRIGEIKNRQTGDELMHLINAILAG